MTVGVVPPTWSGVFDGACVTFASAGETWNVRSSRLQDGNAATTTMIIIVAVQRLIGLDFCNI